MKVICFDLLQKTPQFYFFLLHGKRIFNFIHGKGHFYGSKSLHTQSFFRIYATFTDFGNFLSFSKEIYIFSSNIRNFRRI